MKRKSVFGGKKFSLKCEKVLKGNKNQTLLSYNIFQEILIITTIR